MRTLNVKLLVSLLVGLAVLMTGVHVIHGIQIDRNAESLRREAKKADEEKDKRTAVKKYKQYLGHRPNDLEAKIRMALLAADLADSPEHGPEDLKAALKALENAAKRQESDTPETPELQADLQKVRERLVDFLMNLGGGRFIDAIDYLDGLRAAAEAKGKRDPKLDIKWARCKVVIGKDQDALEVLYQLVGYDEKEKTFDVESAIAPDEIDAYLLLSTLLQQRQGKSDQADEVMKQMVLANPESSEAHLRYGRWQGRRIQTGQVKVEDVIAEFQKAAELNPDDPAATLALADVELTLGTGMRGSKPEEAQTHFDAAEALLEGGLKKHPDNAELYRSYGGLALAQGKPDLAIERVTAGLKEVPDAPTLLVFLAYMQLEKHDIDGVRATIDQMKSIGFRPEFVRFYEAQTDLVEQKWLAAVKRFERLRPELAGQSDMILQVDLGLGKCYEALGQPDRAADAFQRVLDVDRLGIPVARLGHARAVYNLGNRKKGADEMRQLSKDLETSKIDAPQVRAALLQMNISEQIQKPEEERDWETIDALVEESLEDKNLTDLQKGKIRIEMLILKDDIPGAEAALNTLLKENPKDVRLWITWLGIQERIALKNHVRKDKLTIEERKQDLHDFIGASLDRIQIAEKAAGDQVPFRVARAAGWARMGDDDLKEKLASLEEGIDQFPPREQAALWEGLGNAYNQLRDFANVKRCYQKLVDERPNELYPWENMFNVAMAYPTDEDAQETALNAANRIGELATTSSPTYNYCVAAQRIAEVLRDQTRLRKEAGGGTVTQSDVNRVNQFDRSKLIEARKYVEQGMRTRRDWHQLYRLAGEIDDIEGHANEAIANYQRAQELGSTDSNMARSLVLLLYRQGKMQDVQSALKHVNRGSFNQQMGRIDIVSQFNAGDRKAALAKAADEVDAKPDELEPRVWYAYLLEQDNQPDKAEEQYRITLEKKPEQPAVWQALIKQLLAQQTEAEAEATKLSDEKKDAEAAEARAKAEKKKAEAIEAVEEGKKVVPEREQPQFFALAYEQIGDLKQAETYQLKLLEENKDSLVQRQALAYFYLKHASDKLMENKARDQVEQILRSPQTTEAAAGAVRAWARRVEAEMLASHGNYSDVEKAINLIKSNSADGTGTPDDLRFLAITLAKRVDSESRKSAIELLEQLDRQQPLTLQEKAGLATLYDQVGNWTKAREIMLDLVTKNSDSPVVLARYIRMRLNHNEISDLGNWIEQLPEAGLPTIELKARWLKKEGRSDEAVTYLESLIPEKITHEDLKMVALIGGLLENLGQMGPAETYMKKWYEQDPEQIVQIAAFYGRAHKLDQSLNLFKKALETKSIAPIGPAIMQTLRVNIDTATAKQKALVEGWVRAAIKKEPDEVRLYLLLVDFLDLNNRFDESIKQYRELLARTDLNEAQIAIVENNLAYLLVTRGTSDDKAEAEKLVGDAILRRGPESSILDTRGLIRLSEGNAKEAASDFQTAVAESPSAVNFFHLAMAQEKLGNLTALKEAFDRVQELTLDPKSLSPVEKEAYDRLVKQFPKALTE